MSLAKIKLSVVAAPLAFTGQAAGPRPPAIELSQASVTFGHGTNAVPALAQTSLRIQRRRVRRSGRPVGLRQVDHPQAGQRAGAADLRRRRRRRPRGRRQGAADRHGLPEPDDAALADDRAERHAAAEDRPAVSRPLSAKEKRGAFRDKAHALLAQVGLKGFAGKYPWQLSGGMLQRANLCRALIHEPRMLLLDEPFGALDQFTREELWAILQELWLAHRPTVLLVTHDLREAGFLASRICVMSARPGRILDDSAVAFARPRTHRDDLRAGFRRAEPAPARSHRRCPRRRLLAEEVHLRWPIVASGKGSGRPH